jgi:hypothetical protein
MQRRTLLLFSLFVVTAWFYSSVAQTSAEAAVNNHTKQAQVLSDVENMLSNEAESGSEQDEG